MEKSSRPRKVLNPKLKWFALPVLFVAAILVFFFISHNGFLVGGLAVLITLGILVVIAQIRGIDMYIPKPVSTSSSQDKQIGRAHV